MIEATTFKQLKDLWLRKEAGRKIGVLTDFSETLFNDALQYAGVTREEFLEQYKG